MELVFTLRIAGAFLPLFPATILAAADPSGVPGWVDSVSRIGVIGFLVLSLYGLQKRWWVPGWAYRELEDRHATLRGRYDRAVDIALTSSRGVARTATVLENALARGGALIPEGGTDEAPR